MVLCRFISWSLKPKSLFTMPFYAVARGKTPGIFMSWSDCEAQVKGFSGARYKKFDSIEGANEFIKNEGGKPASKTKSSGAKKRTSTPSYPQNYNLESNFSTGTPQYYGHNYSENSQNSNVSTSSSKPKTPISRRKSINKLSPNNDPTNNVERNFSTSISYFSEESHSSKSQNESFNGSQNESFNGSQNESFNRSQNENVNSQNDSLYESKENFDSDESDDLNTILMKQMDDIEKRVKSFERGIDKIIKKGSKTSERRTILIEPPKPKKRRSNNHVGFDTDKDGYVQVYTDGACSSNGKYGAKAGLGVFWGDGHPLNASEPVSGRATNNCGEIQAATKAIKQALDNGVKMLSINTDSKFLINSVTKWIPGWKRKGWKLKNGEPVKNEKDFKDLDSVQNKLQVKWNYVEAHRGIHGNEMADQLAKAGAANYK